MMAARDSTCRIACWGHFGPFGPLFNHDVQEVKPASKWNRGHMISSKRVPVGIQMIKNKLAGTESHDVC